jgi:hypothetical protein
MSEEFSSIEDIAEGFEVPVVAITTKAGNFKSVSELVAYNNAQFDTLCALQKENHELRKNVEHLQELLTSTTSLVSSPDPVKIEVSTEQAICEMQIKKLEESAAQRQLSLEETKRLEILIRSLYLIKEHGEGAISADFTSLPMGTSISALAEIASTPDNT